MLTNQLFYYSFVSLSLPYQESNFEMTSPVFVLCFCFLWPFSIDKTNLFSSVHRNTYSSLWNEMLLGSRTVNKANKVFKVIVLIFGKYKVSQAYSATEPISQCSLKNITYIMCIIYELQSLCLKLQTTTSIMFSLYCHGSSDRTFA
jgi:hypothetical protein